MKSFYLETFGCQMNVVDSEQIVGLVQSLGYSSVDSPEQANLIILNTCSIRARAERKVYGHLGRFKPLKQRRPELIIAVCGCVAQQEGQRMLEKVPYLDIVCGTHNIHRLADMVRDAELHRARHVEVDFLEADKRRRLFPERAPSAEVSRFVTVIQGCDNFCSYCIVPHVRGREVSRPSAEVLEEVRLLVEQGAREITLIGQNVNSYGCKEDDEISFASLLRKVAEVDGLERIRFMTSHPKDLSDELIDCFADLDKLCKHIHLPVQAGGDAVLKAMRRGYTRDQYLGRIERLRRVCPEIRMTSDVIVGFPGETESEFEQTMDLLERARFTEIYSFIFSARPGTSAADLPDDIPKEVKQQWFDRMLALQEEITRQYHQMDIGQVLPVLVEGSSRQGNGQLFGRTTWNRIVNFDGNPDLVGRIVPVRLTVAYRNSHLGERV
ncbi:tRNA (2-methylthio-N6-dimethylallyl-A37) methylthiotransferase [Syntrophotalea carbinolica DSM 2380]|uniref:tRNA-2-methylthio-N(6)-dimethylallyladenosine synthase n=2 Tax=Syntrophotalea carbinolica TaxID=19 RepID=MIAB_SYNC1|nr:tRNA (N6-isopentenyl adenosine(37)-C2)-methylthiotransferase MiaB [Syntrophotalea carbinolica]Q3A594.1 RecName: Full=tRNA-2-methylthio-N(6)-dimethylallyladenosine synthase; AltName: Full=(Dimethylallyl)adenosine tRNA methylthiotransferase MiaB; AltName: Full=tRNA-i(6)A37 methylthiotransferase [Syntrophotalea carbinolica DSM 2380]ABA88463.1 tRNA (2-methylthio-N6-dimethylallyl-A37) methylthiotransferase [Syntrophotalea carbinolica DSM 2380]